MATKRTIAELAADPDEQTPDEARGPGLVIDCSKREQEVNRKLTDQQRAWLRAQSSSGAKGPDPNARAKDMAIALAENLPMAERLNALARLVAAG